MILSTSSFLVRSTYIYSPFSGKDCLLRRTETSNCLCEVSAVGRISLPTGKSCGRVQYPARSRVELWAIFLAKPSVDGDVEPLVWSLDILSWDLKEPAHLLIRVG